MLVKEFDIDKLLAVPETTKAYMAGFFDGEGSVSIASRGDMKCSRTDLTKTKRVFALVVHISQNSKPVLDLFYDLFGGTLRQDNRKRTGYSPRAHVMWEWSINGNKQVPLFLRFIKKYLIVKASEVEIALLFGNTYKDLSDESKLAFVDQIRAARETRKLVNPVLVPLGD